MAATSKKITDKYPNRMYGSVTESGANTLTFAEINTNVSIFDKQAFVLHRIEWYVPGSVRDKLVASDDKWEIALTSSQNITSLGLDNPAVIDKLEITMQWATGVGFDVRDQPLMRDFSSMPGGGLLINPRPLFVAIKGTSVSAPGSAQLRCWFSAMTLSADEYIELVDFYRIAGV